MLDSLELGARSIKLLLQLVKLEDKFLNFQEHRANDPKIS
jgi:hypothetical protein